MNLEVLDAYFYYISFAILSTLIEHFHDWRMAHQPEISVYCRKQWTDVMSFSCEFLSHIINFHRTRSFVTGSSMIGCSKNLGYSKQRPKAKIWNESNPTVIAAVIKIWHLYSFKMPAKPRKHSDLHNLEWAQLHIVYIRSVLHDSDFGKNSMSGSSFRSNECHTRVLQSIEPGPLSLFHSVLFHTIVISFYMYNRNISDLCRLHSSQRVI